MPDVTNSAAKPTKKSQLISLLRTKGGKDISAISEKFGRQQHTTRAALSGLRKAGFEITRQTPKSDGAARYPITAGPGATATR